MERIKVKSHMLAEIGYEPATETLEVQFHAKGCGSKKEAECDCKNGDVWQYFPFTRDDWDWFRLQKSIGSHFLREIKNKFSSRKVTPEASGERKAESEGEGPEAA